MVELGRVTRIVKVNTAIGLGALSGLPALEHPGKETAVVQDLALLYRVRLTLLFLSLYVDVSVETCHVLSLEDGCLGRLPFFN